MTAGAEPLVVWIEGALVLGLGTSVVVWPGRAQLRLLDPHRPERRGAL